MSTQRIYLDQAATSWPKLPVAVEAAEKFIHNCGATSGRGAYASAREADRWVTRARHALAQLLGARDAADVAFCNSGTHALNAAISGLLRPGDTVLTTAIEHNSVLRPLEHWRKTCSVNLIIADCDDCGRVAIPEQPPNPLPKLIVISHGSNVTGRLQDLTKWSDLARRCQAILMVDASQSLGYLPIDMADSGIDVLVSAGHKGLGALSGTGFVIARPELQIQFAPLMWGGTGISSEQLDWQPAWPQCIEVGNLNLPAIVSMAAAAEHWLNNSVALRSWETSLQLFLKGFSERLSSSNIKLFGHDGNGDYLPVVSLKPGEWPVHDVASILDSNFGIEVRAGYHCAALIHRTLGTEREGTLRLSFGHNTKSTDVAYAVGALAEIFAVDVSS